MTTRQQVYECAQTWIGTPFHHQARLKGVGVDCLGLIIGVARELQLIAQDFDFTGYPRYPDGKTLLGIALKHMTLIRREEQQPGCIVVVAFETHPQHFGILGNYRHGGLSMLHASSDHGRVTETRLMFSGTMRHVASFDLPGVTG